MRLILCLLAVCSFATTTVVAEDTPGIVHIEKTKDFDDTIAKSAAADGIVVVDLWATWCGPCKMLAPDLEAIVKANPGKITVIKIDVDKAQELAARFKVESIPLLIKFRKGKEVDRQVGYGGKEALAQWVGLKP